MDVRQWRREQRDSPAVYYKGLNLLLNEQHDKAIDAFIEAVQQDPDTSELHFALGDLFRKRGEYERAVRVHQHLLGRADLSKAERDQAQHGLAQDYMRPAPTTRMRSAPRWTAGEIGAAWRIEPSPQYSAWPAMSSATAGKTNGIADEASRCGISIDVRTAIRCERVQGTMSSSAS